ncbi:MULTISPECIES: efflux RND transporter permease subunit [Cyclobacterium]|jgi:Cu(I)/Ag(I) efflux system membrane protein CusA/SilA|uniref:Acriflavin resistance protein n=1 Tax=Cyclobacterium marinum (strain ATCC 25205 / DSM 745 / LMG 13164 / NCIMB 1802) TaxID=880070 RepID=G0J1S7_CYCMS|nr:efflux RND transporter permease subunit [Cyclobacterium marinum]AEL28286.1 acriflavin resistance protein [Cyclobacterium marinum DSM 745]|tara:strand:+ start:41215 stop:45039 length:3825 start_codon:yes stop_codon:yes gene_type:complete
MLNKIIRYFLENKLVTVLILIGFIAWGIVTAPFGWQIGALPSDPVPVDAIPDIGENQQIVFTQWQGRSPQDIEDQISYPLTTYLLGIPGVKSIRSSSIFGFSSIFIIFSEDVEFYWSRSRILEKLSSLPSGLLPEGVQPALGPDATALGQVYWYTIEGRDKDGNPTGGWDLHEIRTVQDFYVKYGLNATEGVSEVASIGGFVQEYQIDVNPDALKAYDIPLHKVMQAVQKSNKDVGAKTIEINQAEYLVRGLGYIKKVEDIEKAVVAVQENVPVRIKDIGVVTLGPSTRRGLLDKDGAEVVGGVVVARYGANPLQVINNVKDKIKEIAPGLPKKTLENGRESQLTIVPFYDRSELIYETLGTLEEAISLQVLITILVVIVMVYNLRASFLISSILPIAVLMVFIAMRYFGVDANIVALSGIAIAIGTMVDLGVILSENIIKHIDEAPPGQRLIETIYNGASEVGTAILTAVSTTIVSFIPVFTMQAAEGKLFGPLAFTKTFALIAALLVSLLIMPTLAHWFFGFKINNKFVKKYGGYALVVLGIIGLVIGQIWGGVLLVLFGTIGILKNIFDTKKANFSKPVLFLYNYAELIIVLIGATWLLAKYWLPLGASKSLLLNFIFVTLLVGFILGSFTLLEYYYKSILKWCLDNKVKFLLIPTFLILLGANVWLGFNTVFGFIPKAFDKLGWDLQTTTVWSGLTHTFPGVGKEFMPSLDEGSFLLMPTSMPHSGIEYNRKVVGQLDMLLTNIPEVDLTVGKLGRVESALDPAPISMYENIINYKPEYMLSEKGHRVRFKVDKEDRFILNSGDSLSNEEAINRGVILEELIPDDNGNYFRNWRPQIKSPDDIWNEIVKVTKIPGVTSAPKLQPIETRLVMLQTGMRAPMGIKVYGPDLKTIEDFGLQLEEVLKNVPSVKAEAVFADRIVGKPYLHLNINRDEISRYGLNVEDVQQTIETAIGGMKITSTVEGRERFPVRVRYPRELRDDPESLGKILLPTPTGAQIPISQVVDFEYVRGPQAIKSEETFLVGYVLFDKRDGYSEVGVVNDAQAAIQAKIDSGELIVPAGISYKFSGSYENQVRAEKRLTIIVPLVLGIVFLILYFQFKSVATSLMVFTGIAMAFSGGFIMLWLYGQTWFADFSIFGTNFRDLFQIHTINLSVAVWVGFIALFGIATDDGVLMATYLDQSFDRNKTDNLKGIRAATVEAGQRRIKPAVMTSATTIIALLPILTSTGRGADIMIPMAIPAFGGMFFAAVTYFIVPVLYCMREERKLNKIQS